MRLLAFVLVAAVLVSAAPTSAVWRSAGSFEPDTAFDGPEFMFPEADTSPWPEGGRVYFNAFATQHPLVLNPNVGAVEGRAFVTPVVVHRALLGVWKDCNADGYVGMAEGALGDYRVELLMDGSRCPVGSSHNDGLWVTEMIMIGMVDPCEYKEAGYRAANCPNPNPGVTTTTVPAFVRNVRVLYLNDTYVWGDTGAPGDAPARQCALAPLPRGSTAGSGALLRFADCHAGHAVARAVNQGDGDGALGLRFDDPENPQSGASVLNQAFPVNLFGDPATGRTGLLQRESDAGSFALWDCSDPKGGADVADPTGGTLSGLAVEDPTGGELSGSIIVPVLGVRTVFADEDGDAGTPGVLRPGLADEDGSIAWFAAPAPTVRDPTSSSWVAASRAADGARGDCDAENGTPLDGTHPGARLEDESDATIGALRDRSSFVMWFYDGYRGIDPRTDFVYPPTAPADGGVTFTRNHYGGAMWSEPSFHTQLPPIERDGLEGPGPTHVTFYASLPEASVAELGLVLPSPTVGIYGADACPTIGPEAGDSRGWVCDPGRWWRNANGADETPRFSEGERVGRVVGDAFHLRDVDCLDGRAAGAAPAITRACA